MRKTLQNPSFRAIEWCNGIVLGFVSREPSGKPHTITRLHTVVGSRTFDFTPGNTYFLYQYRGQSWLRGETPLLKDHYAVASYKNEWVAGSDDSLLMIIEQEGKEAPFLLGGPIEAEGRLKYIDGCTDSLLLAPWKYGEPCLNHLHFPAGIDQTMHTHPSVRIGLVVRGMGECITPFGNIPLYPGQLFFIYPENGNVLPGLDGKEHLEGSHCFRTPEGSEMDVVAFHPDSDFGPKDEDHPMVNKTIVAGVSAAHIPEIRTQ